MAGESIGWKSEFHLHNGTALVKLANVTSITPPSPEIEEVETTDLDATNRYRTFIPGMRDPGTVEVVMNYVGGSATDTLVRAFAASLDTRSCKVVYSDDDGTPLRQITFSAFATGLSEPEITTDGLKTYTLTLRVSGAITEAVAA